MQDDFNELARIRSRHLGWERYPRNACARGTSREKRKGRRDMAVSRIATRRRIASPSLSERGLSGSATTPPRARQLKNASTACLSAAPASKGMHHSSPRPLLGLSGNGSAQLENTIAILHVVRDGAQWAPGTHAAQNGGTRHGDTQQSDVANRLSDA